MSLLSDYRPLPENEFGITPRQIAERRASVRRVSFLRYSNTMTKATAAAVIALPKNELMSLLKIDNEQSDDLKWLAERHLERYELAGVK